MPARAAASGRTSPSDAHWFFLSAWPNLLCTPDLPSLPILQVLSITEKDLMPDFVIRSGIRYLLSQRKKEVSRQPRLGAGTHMPIPHSRLNPRELLCLHVRSFFTSVSNVLPLRPASTAGAAAAHANSSHSAQAIRVEGGCFLGAPRRSKKRCQWLRAFKPAPARLSSAAAACIITIPGPQSNPTAGEAYYQRLQAFRDELAGMPVAVQVTHPHALPLPL